MLSRLMPTDETARLPWERDGDSFVAYPDGRGVLGHVVTVAINPPSFPDSARWRWSVRCGDTTDGGVCSDKQAAADAATGAWPRAKEEARLAEAQGAVERDLRERVAEVERSGWVDIDSFELGATDRKDLLLLIRECRARWEHSFQSGGDVTTVQQLMNAISEELYRRRMSADGA